MTPKEFSDALRDDPEAALKAVREKQFDPNSFHEGVPALLEAVANKQYDIADLLIKRGADVDAYARAPSSMQGLAAIHVAGTPALVGMLSEARAFMDAPIKEIDRSWGMRGETALHCAALDARSDVAAELLRRGANSNLPFNTSGPSTALDVRSGQTLSSRLAQFKLVDQVRRNHNQVALETMVEAKIVRDAIPMTTEGLAHMRDVIETHTRSQNAMDNMHYQLNNPPAEASLIEKSARVLGKLVASLIDDVKFMAGAIKTRVQYEALSPQTSQQKTASVLAAINDGTSVFMADAKRSMQAYREQAAEVHKNDLAQSPHG